MPNKKFLDSNSSSFSILRFEIEGNMQLKSFEAYIFDPRPNYPLVSAVKRYRNMKLHHNLAAEHDPAAITVVFAHATGFFKESFEPVIDQLFQLAETQREVTILEAWSVDAPNHGESAVLNEKTLQRGYNPFGWEEYSRSLHMFLAGLGKGVDVDFSKRNLVAIGHSMGGTCLITTTAFYPLVKIRSLILVEPMLIPYEDRGSNFLLEAAKKRRDIWPSKKDALETFRSKGFKNWEERQLKLYIEHGLRSLPTLEYPDRTDGVTLTCTKAQEAATFSDTLGPFRAIEYLPYCIKRNKVHIVFGAKADFVPMATRDKVLNVVSGGISNFASVSTVDGAGHLVTQTHPQHLTRKIWEILRSTAEQPLNSKL